MGMSASQCRYLSLTARKSDLEYQAQMINQARLALANKSSDASKAYNSGMSNKIIKIAVPGKSTDGTVTKSWQELTYANLLEMGCDIIGAYGEQLDPSPYMEYEAGTQITGMKYESLPDSVKDKLTANEDGTYTAKVAFRVADSTFNGMDIQALLVSGRGQIVTSQFFNFLKEHGYGTGTYYTEKGEPTTYKALLDQYESQASTSGTNTVIDWRSDTSCTFNQFYYSEDDGEAHAKYEAVTSEIQAEDKTLELELKKIETEHNAIQTEMDAVKKVIEKNIENTYKTFG